MASTDSDSDEFYECDDYEENEDQTSIVQTKSNIKNSPNPHVTPATSTNDAIVEAPYESEITSQTKKQSQQSKQHENNNEVDCNKKHDKNVKHIPELGSSHHGQPCDKVETRKNKTNEENIENQKDPMACSLENRISKVNITEDCNKNIPSAANETTEKSNDDMRQENSPKELPVAQENLCDGNENLADNQQKSIPKGSEPAQISDENLWDDKDGWGDIDEPTAVSEIEETDAKSSENKEDIKIVEKESKYEKSAVNTEENQSETSKTKENIKQSHIKSKSRNIETNLEARQPITSKNDDNNAKSQVETKHESIEAKQEENLWNDDDDWNAKEEKPASKVEQAEEDLWGDGDGWEIETPKDTPQKSQAKENEADLWGEEDGWEIEDDPVDNKPKQQETKRIENVFSPLTSQGDSWGGWGTWGISSVLSSAASTAANLTTSVSQGISNVLETGIGVPDPEELARRHRQAELENKDMHEENDDLPLDQKEDKSELGVPFGLGTWVSGVSTITKLVETTGTKVISGGLGTLETIGKKTYEVLQENDPQLRKKRAFLKQFEGEKPVLSQLLREAKERAESENEERERRHFAKKANYETMFDDYQGLVHLEALEMLSKQCDIKLQTILSQANDVNDLQETMDQVKDLCELTTEDDEDEMGDFDEIKEKINTAIDEINIGISCDKLLAAFVDVTKWIRECSTKNQVEVHSNAIENLAQITAMAVEQYHKAGELLLIKEHRSTADEADSLVQMTTALSALISILSTQYTEKLKILANETPSTSDEIKGLISNIFLEAANSSRYIEDAFQLLIPVIQVGAV